MFLSFTSLITRWGKVKCITNLKYLFIGFYLESEVKNMKEVLDFLLGLLGTLGLGKDVTDVVAQVFAWLIENVGKLF